jgi:hypothetical protein
MRRKIMDIKLLPAYFVIGSVIVCAVFDVRENGTIRPLESTDTSEAITLLFGNS